MKESAEDVAACAVDEAAALFPVAGSSRVAAVVDAIEALVVTGLLTDLALDT